MEFNLKNRPKRKGSMPYVSLGSEWDEWYRAVDKWFQGFEKELRYKLEKIREATTRETHSQILLEEILG